MRGGAQVAEDSAFFAHRVPLATPSALCSVRREIIPPPVTYRSILLAQAASNPHQPHTSPKGAADSAPGAARHEQALGPPTQKTKFGKANPPLRHVTPGTSSVRHASRHASASQASTALISEFVVPKSSVTHARPPLTFFAHRVYQRRYLTIPFALRSVAHAAASSFRFPPSASSAASSGM